MDRDYLLTPKQMKAWNSLKRALKKCDEAGLYIWDNFGVLSAVNGNIVKELHPMDGMDPDSRGDELNTDMVESFICSCFHAGNGDDSLIVDYREDC